MSATSVRFLVIASPLYACCSAAAASAWARLLGGLALEGLKAVLVDPGDQRGIVLAHDVALDHTWTRSTSRCSRMRVLCVMMSMEPLQLLR